VKITIFGLTLSSSWANGHATPYRALLRGLHRLGHSCVFYEKDVEYYSFRRDFTTCDYARLVLYSDWADVRTEALRDARDSDAVIVGSYCPGGAQISDEVLPLTTPLRVFYDLISISHSPVATSFSNLNKPGRRSVLGRYTAVSIPMTMFEFLHARNLPAPSATWAPTRPTARLNSSDCS